MKAAIMQFIRNKEANCILLKALAPMLNVKYVGTVPKFHGIALVTDPDSI
nr:hypothetical protein [uncultured Flavobacterium sp.]